MANLSYIDPREYDTFPPELRNPGKPTIHDSILTTIGNTPLVKLNKMGPSDVNIYVKCEAFNPMSSVKDRLALGVIEWAERHGMLKPGQTVVEASSGNTGIGLAMVCNTKGYPFVCVMSEAFSIERRKLMRFLGAKVVLTNGAHKATGMMLKTQELADKFGWFAPNQFVNEANAWIHTHTTGPEIVQALGSKGKKLDFFVTGFGTGGTFKGTSRYLRKHSPDTQIILAEPDNAPMILSGESTEFKPDGTIVAPHSAWRPHLLQGWSPDFIPQLVGDAVEASYMDHLIHIGSAAAMSTARELARKEGIFTGTSGGGTLSGAIEIAADREIVPSGSTIVVMLPDTGERYLSTPLFADIPADMTAEEKELAGQSIAPPPIILPEISSEDVAWVNYQIDNNKVCIWAMQYCEFCWTIFKFFDAIKVPYKKINWDSIEYAENNQGNKYRRALQDRSNEKTYPQCFIDGQFFGGAADACIKWKKGELQPLLEAAGVKHDNFNNFSGDPFEFLPKWMQQNPLRSK